MTKWQPIDTAPRDGTDILVFRMDCGVIPIVHVAFYLSEEEWTQNPPYPAETKEDFVGWWSYVYSSFSREKLIKHRTPTHWMPLPEPPKEDLNDR